MFRAKTRRVHAKRTNVCRTGHLCVVGMCNKSALKAIHLWSVQLCVCSTKKGLITARQHLNCVFNSSSWVQSSPLLPLKNSRLLGSSRDFGSSESRSSSSWKLPSSLTSSSRSYDRPWAESPLSSRTKSVLDVCAAIHFFSSHNRWNVMIFFFCFFFCIYWNVCLRFPRLILRGRWGCAQECWTPPMMAILKGPKCHTATEDSTQEHPVL